MLLKEQLGFWAINKTLSLRDENSWKSLRLHVAIYREMDGRRSLSIAVHLPPTQSSLLRRPQQIKVTALSSNRPVCRCSRRSNTARRLFFSWCPGFCQPPTPPKNGRWSPASHLWLKAGRSGSSSRSKMRRAQRIDKAICEKGGKFLLVSGGSIYLGDHNAGSPSSPINAI